MVLIIRDMDFLVPYNNVINYTDHEKYIVDEIRDLSKFEWFSKQSGIFGKFSSARFSEVLTEKGMAFTFNVMDCNEMMNLDV